MRKGQPARPCPTATPRGAGADEHVFKQQLMIKRLLKIYTGLFAGGADGFEEAKHPLQRV